jgi:hypothetical protein
MIDVGTPVIIIHDDRYIRFAVSLWLEEDLKMLCKNTTTEFAFYLKGNKTFTRNDIVYYVIPYQEIIIPKQRTTTAHVEITETMPYPITGHKHPVATPSFSDYDTQNIIPNSDISLLVTENGVHQASVRFPITIANTQYIAVIITNNILKYIDNEIPTSLNDNKVNEIHEKAVPQYVETTYKYYYDYFDDYYDIHEGKRRKRK